MSGYALARLDEIDELDDGRCPFRPVRHHLGITSFGVNAWTARAAGDRIINAHDEDEPDGNEELYLVHRGRATFRLDGEEVDAPAGTFVSVSKEVVRTAFAQEAGTTIVAIGGIPGQPYVSQGWELWAPLRPAYEAGRYDEVADRGRDVLASDPPYAAPFYFVAAAESLAGRTDDALAHLRRATELSDETPTYAQGDPAFDPIRDEPAFKDLTAG